MPALMRGSEIVAFTLSTLSTRVLTSVDTLKGSSGRNGREVNLAEAASWGAAHTLCAGS
jgi:hypothetical protein